MIINLKQSVEIEELSELKVTGKDASDDWKVEMTFSKEALIGFATNLLWLYEDIDATKRLHFHVDPLGRDVPGNQALGFFLTPESPTLVLQINGMPDSKLEQAAICKEIRIREGGYPQIEIKEPAANESMEEYELGLRNLVDIKITDGSGENICENWWEVVWDLSYETVKKLAHMLLILADNYSSEDAYLLANLRQMELQYNAGMLFTKESPDLVMKFGDLGSAWEFGWEE